MNLEHGTKKRLFVLGASGRTGAELIDLALARGHRVTAFGRSPAKITRRHGLLSVVKGAPRNVEELAAALPGHDAVLSALGPTPREAMTHSTLLQECASSTLAAMSRADVRRFSIVSSALLFRGGGPLPAFFRLLIRHHLRDLEAMEALVRASPVEWTIARPPRLVKVHDEGYRASAGAMPPGATLSSVVSWRAVAAFLLDAAEAHLHLREVVGLVRGPARGAEALARAPA